MTPFTQKTTDDPACFTQNCVAFLSGLKQIQQFSICSTGKKALITKCFGPETVSSPCCKASILHGAVI